jgi:acetyltransferase-like isoleucine patch superfamily enzyme
MTSGNSPSKVIPKSLHPDIYDSVVGNEERMSEDKMHVIDGCRIGDNTNIAEFAVLQDCEIGEDCQVWNFVNLYGCNIGDSCMIGTFVEIQEDVSIGDNCRIQSHAFLCSMVEVEDDVFISHGAKFINDRYPPGGNREEWESTVVREGASIGTNATLLPVEIGENATVGAGSVVTEDVPPNAVVAGNPAEVIGYNDK